MLSLEQLQHYQEEGYLILQYSQVGARNPNTEKVFENGPVIVRGGKSVYEGGEKSK